MGDFRPRNCHTPVSEARRLHYYGPADDALRPEGRVARWPRSGHAQSLPSWPARGAIRQG